MEARQPFRFKDGERVSLVSPNAPIGAGSPLLAGPLLRALGTPEERQEALEALHHAADDLDAALASIRNLESSPAAELRAARDAIAGAVEPFEELLRISEQATDSLRRWGREFDAKHGQVVGRTGKPGRPPLMHRELIALVWKFEIAGRPGPGESEEIPKSAEWYTAELLDRVADQARQLGIPDAELTHAKIKSAVQKHHNVPGAVRAERQRRGS